MFWQANLSFEKLELLHVSSDLASLSYHSFERRALPPLLTSFLRQLMSFNDKSVGKLSEVPIKTASTQSYLSLVGVFVH